jgi:hypothetical protein
MGPLSKSNTRAEMLRMFLLWWTLDLLPRPLLALFVRPHTQFEFSPKSPNQALQPTAQTALFFHVQRS